MIPDKNVWKSHRKLDEENKVNENEWKLLQEKVGKKEKKAIQN